MGTGALLSLRFLAIVLNIIFLFSYGTGQAFCLCSDDDDCRGVANILLTTKAVELSKTICTSFVLEENEIQNNIAQLQATETEDNCCSNCFQSINSAITNIAPIYFVNFAKEQIACSDIFCGTNREETRGYGVRAPPAHGPGSKTYLAKRVFLI